MDEFLNAFNKTLAAFNGVLWSDWALYAILITGVIFTIWTKFSPILALTHGVRVLTGRYDQKGDPGAISHFQALSAALSATVGLGNIGGVAIAVSLGGPGAVFWMWVVGLIGMSLKTTEVTLSMLYRNTSDPDNPHGGPMWVVQKGLTEMSSKLAGLGKVLGMLFCVTLLISAVTGGNMFQSWNVAEVTNSYFGVPKIFCGILLAALTGSVIIGGIKRIGLVAGRLVPLMCMIYLIAGLVVLAVNVSEIPSLLKLIFVSAFSSTEAAGAFLGGTFGYTFLWGMKRALFSNEAGQGSAPIAHSAAKTKEPVREGVVAGLEPFIDTLVICTITALVILSSGAWNRGPDYKLDIAPNIIEVGPGQWTLEPIQLSRENTWRTGQQVFVLLKGTDIESTGSNIHQVVGRVSSNEPGGHLKVDQWSTYKGSEMPSLHDLGLYLDYRGASLTAHAFDLAVPGLGMWMITIGSWFFALSTIISWSYYGEQGIIYLAGNRGVLPYKIIYCGLVIVSTLPLVRTTEELGNLTDLGTGVMLFVNIPICLLMAPKAMRAYHHYARRVRSGSFEK